MTKITYSFLIVSLACFFLPLLFPKRLPDSEVSRKSIYVILAEKKVRPARKGRHMEPFDLNAFSERVNSGI